MAVLSQVRMAQRLAREVHALGLGLDAVNHGLRRSSNLASIADGVWRQAWVRNQSRVTEALHQQLRLPQGNFLALFVSCTPVPESTHQTDNIHATETGSCRLHQCHPVPRDRISRYTPSMGRSSSHALSVCQGSPSARAPLFSCARPYRAVNESVTTLT
jgi:hypothetical protein